MISASRVPTYLACPAAAVLPHAPYNTAHAEAGIEHHTEMEAAADTGGDGLPDRVRVFIGDGAMSTECAFAYDVASDTARELGHVQRKYVGLTPYEIPGQVDLLARGTRTRIVDHKGHERVEPAATNTQLATYALMVARTYGLDEVDVAIAYKDGWLDTATLGPLELDAHAVRLRQLQIDVARAVRDPQPRIGRQCRYCEAFMSCPAQADLRRETDTVLPMRIEASLPFHDDREAADAFDLLDRIKLLEQRIRSALYARAGERPIPLNDGRVLGPVEKLSNTEIDLDKAHHVLVARFGPQIANECVTKKMTQAGIERALKKHGHDRMKREVMKQIADAGGAKRETRTVIEPHSQDSP